MSATKAEVQREWKPIITTDSELARLYTHIHPVIILSGFLFQFKSLVADPVTTLSASLAPLGALQVLYVVLCLPPFGSKAIQKPNSTSKVSAGRKSQQSSEVALSSKIMTAILATVLIAILGAPLIMILLILFGAPVTTHLPHTFLASANIALLSSLPLVYVHGVDTESWRRVAALMLPIDEVFGAAVGTVLGTWLGAVPIPLDWDREWQKWPVTIVTGAYMGWAVGKYAGKYLLRGKVIDLSA